MTKTAIAKIVALVACLTAAEAFRAPLAANRARGTRHALRMVSAADKDVDKLIAITGTNFELTPALKNRVQQALSAPLAKMASLGIVRVDAHLSVLKHHQPAKKARAEVTVYVPGQVIRRAEESDDMYTSVDLVSHTLMRAMRKLKKRRERDMHGNVKDAVLLDDVDEGSGDDAAPFIDDFQDTFMPEVTKIKSFDLSRPVSLEEAVMSLDYVDHDFFVFRDEETNEINVVYRRHGGRGVGLIQPES